MDLKFDDIKAFLETYRSGTITAGAKALGLTQSALSQKIFRLEETLQASLFIRHPRSLELTASGEKLLGFAKDMQTQHNVFMENFFEREKEMTGVLRIAGFSSVVRSLVIPRLSAFLRKNPKVSIEFRSYEMFELESVLKKNQADLIISDYFLNLPRTEQMQIGEEEYVIIQSKKYKQVPNTYLDHGPFDNATDSYFAFINEPTEFERRYVGDVYSIIDTAALGLGRAVMSKHLIANDSRFKIIKKKGRFTRPLVLTYFKQNYYSALKTEVISLIQSLN